MNLTVQLTQKIGGIGCYREMDRGPHFANFRWIDVHHHLLCPARQTFRSVSGHGHVQPRSNGHQQVGILQCKIGATRRQGAGASKTERMIIGDEIQTQPGRQRRYVKAFQQSEQFLLGFGSPNAIADQQYRALCLIQKAYQLFNLFAQLRSGPVFFRLWDLVAGEFSFVDHGCLNIEGNINPNRAAPARASQENGFLQMIADSFGLLDGNGVLGDRIHDRYDIDLLNTQDANARIPFQVGSFNLAGNE